MAGMRSSILAMSTIAITLAGCRDYESADGEAFADQHVLAGRPASAGGPELSLTDLRRGFAVSTDAALVPLRDYLRSELRLTGDLRGAVTFSTNGGTSATLSLAALNTERLALCEAQVPAFLGPTGDPCTAFDLTFDGLVDHVNLQLRDDLITARWGEGRDREPGIVVGMRIDVDVDPTDGLPDPGPGYLDLELLLAPSADDYDSYSLAEPSTAATLQLISLEATGFGSFGDRIETRARAIVSLLTTDLGRMFAAPPLAQPPELDALTAWCRARHPGGCPLGADQLALATGRLATLASTTYTSAGGLASTVGAPLDAASLDLIARGGWVASVTLEGHADALRDLCAGSPSFRACALLPVCATPPSTAFAELCAGVTTARFGATTTPHTIPASPTVALMLQPIPGLIPQLGRLYRAPFEAYNRRSSGEDIAYFSASSCAVGTACAGVSGARFVFPIDNDHDGIPFVDDNCPSWSWPDTTDTDGDGRGDGCDSCPEVIGWGGGDRDDDGTPDLCDCDLDADSCNNAVTRYDGVALCAVNGEVFDQVPRVPNPPDVDDRDHDGDRGEPVDIDGDGAIDDCDVDDDGDGVSDYDDNCRWVPNPDQLDSGGTRAGDACDAACPGPGAAGCTNPFGLPSLDWFDMKLVRALVPAWTEPPLCLVDGPGCWLLIAPDPVDPAALLLTSALGAPGARLTAGDLGFGHKALGARVAVDLDADGREELLVALPKSGEVVAFDAARAKVLWRIAPLGQVGSSAELGAAMLIADGELWVGAPGADGGRGAVARLTLGLEPKVAMVHEGNSPGERYGAALAQGPGVGVLITAETAKVAAGTTAGRTDWVVGDALVDSFEGVDASGGPGTRALAVTADLFGEAGVLVASPGARNGAGAVALFGLDGGLRWKSGGATGDRYGTSLTRIVAGGGPALLIGAPGLGGGRFYALASTGVATPVVVGRAGDHLGRWAVWSDLTGDGKADLALGAQPTYLAQ